MTSSLIASYVRVLPKKSGPFSWIVTSILSPPALLLSSILQYHSWTLKKEHEKYHLLSFYAQIQDSKLFKDKENIRLWGQSDSSLAVYDLSFTMKSGRTPIKLKVEDISKSRKSPGRATLSRRQASDFQPGLYISPRFGEEEVLAIKEAFDTYDSNGNGLLTPNDLKVALFHQGFHASKETVYNIIAEYDEDCLGGLNFAAFMRIISSQPAETQPLSEMKKVFRRMDRDNKGYLDRRDLEILLKSLGEQWEEREIDMVLQKADSKDGVRISFQNFCKIMHHPCSLF